jgi:hypothetical protein
MAFLEDLDGGLGPGEGMCPVIPAVYEGAALGVEIPDGSAGAAADGLLLTN